LAAVVGRYFDADEIGHWVCLANGGGGPHNCQPNHPHLSSPHGEAYSPAATDQRQIRLMLMSTIVIDRE
jgi:hypothetical protein